MRFCSEYILSRHIRASFQITSVDTPWETMFGTFPSRLLYCRESHICPICIGNPAKMGLICDSRQSTKKKNPVGIREWVPEEILKETLGGIFGENSNENPKESLEFPDKLLVDFREELLGVFQKVLLRRNQNKLYKECQKKNCKGISRNYLDELQKQMIGVFQKSKNPKLLRERISAIW